MSANRRCHATVVRGAVDTSSSGDSSEKSEETETGTGSDLFESQRTTSELEIVFRQRTTVRAAPDLIVVQCALCTVQFQLANYVRNYLVVVISSRNKINLFDRYVVTSRIIFAVLRVAKR